MTAAARPSARHRSDNKQRFAALGDRVGQGLVRRIVGEVLAAGEKPEECPAPARGVVADGPAQHGVTGLEGVEHRTDRHGTLDLNLHLAVHAGEGPQVRRNHDADHGSVWTSTESTAGRSRTMGAQVSPASAEPYTYHRRAEVHAAAVQRIHRHRVAQHIHIAVRLRQPLGQRLPLVAARAAAVNAQLPVGGIVLRVALDRHHIDGLGLCA